MTPYPRNIYREAWRFFWGGGVSMWNGKVLLLDKSVF